MDGFWCVFCLIWSYLECKSKEVKTTGYLWENFWKTRKCVQKRVSADKLISIWEHHRQVFVFETWRGSLGLQNVARDFWFLFRFQDMAINFSCSQNWAFFFEIRQEQNGQGHGISKLPYTLLETRYWWAKVGRFSATVLVFEINSREGTKNIVWQMAKFLYNFVLKINATISWNFLPTLGRNFFPQFSPVDPFENELYTWRVKSFSSKNLKQVFLWQGLLKLFSIRSPNDKGKCLRVCRSRVSMVFDVTTHALICLSLHLTTGF